MPVIEALQYANGFGVLPCQEPCYDGFVAVGVCRRVDVPLRGRDKVVEVERRQHVHGGGGVVSKAQLRIRSY